MPNKWEERTALYCAYLVKNGIQSSTSRSYISAIKAVLQDDNYVWDNSLILLSTLTRACRLENDVIRMKLPIQVKLLELLLFEIKRIFTNSGQMYLSTLYKTIFLTRYYSLFCIGELTTGRAGGNKHTIKAVNVHVAQNKDKIMIMLYSSKMHDKHSLPQRVKITGMGLPNARSSQGKKFFCPFVSIKEYVDIRGGYCSDNEPFFVFMDGSSVTNSHIRPLLKTVVSTLGLDHRLYETRGLRTGHTCNMLKYGYTVEEIKRAGRWKSNAVFRYLKQW